MINFSKLIFLNILLFSLNSWSLPVGGFNLTESGSFVYDADPTGNTKLEAQIKVDQAKKLGSKHIVLNMVGKMVTGRGNEVVSTTPPAEKSKEVQRVIRLIKYIKSQGLTVGIRPIFFVVGPNGEFPYYETIASGQKKLWWHGNIQPQDPNRWFDSFRTFLDGYMTVAKIAKADEFTIGAELYSMTVGIEDQWKEYPYGFPGRWLALLRYVKNKLPNTQIMYDINFTDDSNTESGFEKSGGELERWRYRIVDLASPSNPEEFAIWTDLVTFWKELDAVGIDMYRSLASANQEIPKDYTKLVELLKQRADSYAQQLDNTVLEISSVTEVDKLLIFKEIGYRSVENGFIDPFVYASKNLGQLNLMHQAAAYDAFLAAFWDAGWGWFGGVYFWDISIDPSIHGPLDKGFSPLGKDQTEKNIKNRFLK